MAMHPIPSTLLASALLFGVVSAVPAADTYPQRPVRLIIPYPPGGAGDIVGRMLATRPQRGAGPADGQ